MNRSQLQSIRQTIPFTQDQLCEMAIMYRQVRSLRRVGERFGININAVRSRLVSQGIEILPFSRQPIIPYEEHRVIAEKIKAGVPALEIAFEYGVHESTVRKYAAKYSRTEINYMNNQ